jgi:hypothetical protein
MPRNGHNEVEAFDKFQLRERRHSCQSRRGDECGAPLLASGMDRDRMLEESAEEVVKGRTLRPFVT